MLDGLSLFAPTTFPNASAPYQTLLSPTPTSSPSFSARTTTVRRRTALGRAQRDAGPIRARLMRRRSKAPLSCKKKCQLAKIRSRPCQLATHPERDGCRRVWRPRPGFRSRGVALPGALSLRPGARSQPSHVRPSPRCRAPPPTRPRAPPHRRRPRRRRPSRPPCSRLDDSGAPRRPSPRFRSRQDQGGYTGGDRADPTYASVCAGDGHTEAVKIIRPGPSCPTRSSWTCSWRSTTRACPCPRSTRARCGPRRGPVRGGDGGDRARGTNAGPDRVHQG